MDSQSNIEANNSTYSNKVDQVLGKSHDATLKNLKIDDQYLKIADIFNFKTSNSSKLY